MLIYSSLTGSGFPDVSGEVALCSEVLKCFVVRPNFEGVP